MKHTKEQVYFVFDVESVGLHGEGFAVGFVVVDGYGSEIQHGLIACPSDNAQGTKASRDWVTKNVPESDWHCRCLAPSEVRGAFWREYQSWKSRGAILAADCSWPVEARFLAQCVGDDFEAREWNGPYPLVDISSVLFAKGIDPLGKFERKENELPEHNPLADARQSARLLIENL